MTDRVISTCDSCPARVIWAKNIRTHAAAPIDAEPVVGGNIHLMDREGGVYYAVLNAQQQATKTWGTLYKSHFATCPNAARHRLGDRSKKQKGFGS